MRPDRERDLQPEAESAAERPARAPEHSGADPGSVQRMLAHGDPGAKARLLLRAQQLGGNAAVARLLARQHTHTHHADDPALEWDEFEAAAPANSQFDAATYSGMEWSLPAPALEVEKDGAQWKARVVFDPAQIDTARAFMDPTKSWVKEGHETATLLAHEQGHFDISDVIAEKTETAMETFLTSKGVGGWFKKASKNAAQNAAVANWNKWTAAKKVGKVFKKGQTVREQAQTDYDADPPVGTKHGQDAAKQAAWQADIAAGLPNYDVQP